MLNVKEAIRILTEVKDNNWDESLLAALDLAIESLEEKVSTTIRLAPNKQYIYPIANGVLRIDGCTDMLYPGVDIDFIPYYEDETNGTRPRVLIEAPIDEETGEQENLRVLVWGDPDCEDYTTCVNFKNTQKSKKQNPIF